MNMGKFGISNMTDSGAQLAVDYLERRVVIGRRAPYRCKKTLGPLKDARSKIGASWELMFLILSTALLKSSHRKDQALSRAGPKNNGAPYTRWSPSLLLLLPPPPPPPPPYYYYYYYYANLKRAIMSAMEEDDLQFWK